MKEEEILSIQKCNCHRSYCDFFSGAIGEYGSSFGRGDLEEILSFLKNPTDAIKYLEELLKVGVD